MRETWVRPNYRAIGFGMIPPVLFAALGAWMMFALGNSGSPWWRWLGGAILVGSGALVVALVVQLRKPRVAYDDGFVLFHLQAGPPIAVPVGIVEAFFLGQGPSMLPGESPETDSTVNLIARLSQRELQWRHQDVKPALGHWCDGYVTIRGTWCEPLNEQLVRGLNRRLNEVTPPRK